MKVATENKPKLIRFVGWQETISVNRNFYNLFK
jgi:hypothetical protein